MRGREKKVKKKKQKEKDEYGAIGKGNRNWTIGDVETEKGTSFNRL